MKNLPAFTLLELLIVVAILGILAALAIPQYQNALIRTKLSRAQADMETLNKALTLEIMDNYNRYSNQDREYSYGPFCSIYHYLTTPVAYLSSIDQAFDIFGVDMLKKDPEKIKTFSTFSIEELEMIQICYVIHWSHYVPYMERPMEKNFTGVQYRISAGPDEAIQQGLVSDSRKVPYLFFYRGDTYDPSNGVCSFGDLMFTNYPVNKILTDHKIIRRNAQ